ncbi:hypothetical protein PFISCL1PPCAC_7102 [Pristionchus fissidentatus]|uniref:Nuclear receptor n=1 Tax=Pristionchus fissidentatus TaxID=1538716 RepID=A0AAV5VB73_9BILA|nr:hypothetical protein PFISCL1PPCAC_7102 [Pristionchus fissidentatus]
MEEDGQRLCLVCMAKSDSAHFGVDSCRACAAFFRRTVSLKKRYICRQGTLNCEVNKDVRYICRRCRYNKCLSIGMHPDNVHSKPKKSSTEDSFANYDGDSSSGSAGPSSSLPNGAFSDIEIKQEPSAFKQLSPCILTIGTSEEMPMLNRIDTHYRMTCVVRRTSEHTAILATCPAAAAGITGVSNLFSRQDDQNTPRPATWGTLNQCMNVAITCMGEFANRCFDCFSELESQEQWILIQHYITSMFIFEGSYRTKKLFPGKDDVFLLSYNTYIDLNEVETFFVDAPQIMDKKEAAKLLRDNIKNSLVEWMGTILDRADLTETECIALYGLLMFPPYLAKGTPNIARFTHDIHQTIHKELNVFYKEKMRLEDPSARFAHLTAIQLCVQGIVYKIKEDMEIYRLLNIFDESTYVYAVVQR